MMYVELEALSQTRKQYYRYASTFTFKTYKVKI
jgi:hypothetical protein